MLVDLNWQVGEFIASKVESGGWGRAVVEQLADYPKREQHDVRGLAAQNLWRMKQFFEAYRSADPILSALLRELPWAHNLFILGKCTTPEERTFYLRLAAKERWSSRDPDRN